jgi:hypothetical protein
MRETDREIVELLIDCAGALRDGCIPTFLKSITRREAQTIASWKNFRAATGIVQLLNSAAFDDHVARPNLDLFISRVNAKILSRLKLATSSRQAARVVHAKSGQPPRLN